jgi:hypothetical protein
MRGGPPERLVATLFIVGALMSLAVTSSSKGPFDGFEMDLMLVDATMFILLITLALCSSRFWPLTMAGLQGAELLGHLARLVVHGVVPPAYFTITVAWSFPMLVLLGFGTWRHRQRLSLYGRDYAWAWELPPDYRSKGI